MSCTALSEKVTTSKNRQLTIKTFNEVVCELDVFTKYNVANAVLYATITPGPRTFQKYWLLPANVWKSAVGKQHYHVVDELAPIAPWYNKRHTNEGKNSDNKRALRVICKRSFDEAQTYIQSIPVEQRLEWMSRRRGKGFRYLPVYFNEGACNDMLEKLESLEDWLRRQANGARNKRQRTRIDRSGYPVIGPSKRQVYRDRKFMDNNAVERAWEKVSHVVDARRYLQFLQNTKFIQRGVPMNIGVQFKDDRLSDEPPWRLGRYFNVPNVFRWLNGEYGIQVLDMTYIPEQLVHLLGTRPRRKDKAQRFRELAQWAEAPDPYWKERLLVHPAERGNEEELELEGTPSG